MKKIMMRGVFAFAVALLFPQIVHSQGTMTYLSNLGQTSAGSLPVGSDSWLAVEFFTGTNAGGYALDSIQLGMADASGNPSDFTAMIYAPNSFAFFPGGSIGTLNGSLNPTPGGVFTYSSTSSIALLPSHYYFFVLSAGTAVDSGAYDLNYVAARNYAQDGGWVSFGGTLTSSDGSSWNSISSGFPQFAINAIPVPEPGVLGLFGLGGLFFLWHRRKSKEI
jgi:hypothetical protein